MIIYAKYLTQLETGKPTKRMCTQITIVLTAKSSISYFTNIIFEERKKTNILMIEKKIRLKKLTDHPTTMILLGGN